MLQPFFCWIDLAQAYGDVGGLDLMRQAYDQVLDLDRVLPRFGFDVPGRAWIRVAQLYEDLEPKLKAYRNATQDPVEDPIWELPSASWLYMARDYLELSQYDEAIEASQKALAISFPRPLFAWMIIGKARYLSGRLKDAKDAFVRAVEESQDLPDFLRQEAKQYLDIVSTGLQPEDLSSDDLSDLKHQANLVERENQPEQRILRKINEAKHDQYEKYLRKPPSGRDNTLSILRGWSSAVTLLEGSDQLWRGGGYFLKWQGKGLVIDPGFGFLRNLWVSWSRNRRSDR